MNLKIGNDIIETERIKKAFAEHGDKFKKRIFTDNEIAYCEGKGENKYQSYAARFAAKEAIFKAISEVLENKYSVSWTDIEILNDENGKPHATIKDVDVVECVDISLSHVKDFAIATAIVNIVK